MNDHNELRNLRLPLLPGGIELEAIGRSMKFDTETEAKGVVDMLANLGPECGEVKMEYDPMNMVWYVTQFVRLIPAKKDY